MSLRLLILLLSLSVALEGCAAANLVQCVGKTTYECGFN